MMEINRVRPKGLIDEYDVHGDSISPVTGNAIAVRYVTILVQHCAAPHRTASPKRAWSRIICV